MAISQRPSGNDLILTIDGDFDAAAVRLMRPELESAASAGAGRLVLDLSAVGFLDSSGIGAIVFLYKRLRADGKSLLLCGAQGQPHRLLGMLHIYENVPHVASLAAVDARRAG